MNDTLQLAEFGGQLNGVDGEFLVQTKQIEIVLQ